MPIEILFQIELIALGSFLQNWDNLGKLSELNKNSLLFTSRIYIDLSENDITWNEVLLSNSTVRPGQKS